MIAAMMIFHQAGVNPWPAAVSDVRKGGRRQARSTAMMTHHLAGVILLGPTAARADVGQSGALEGVNATVTVIVIVIVIVIVSARSAGTTRTTAIVIVAVTVMLWTSDAAGGAVDHTTSVAVHARNAAVLVSVSVIVIASPPMTARSVIGPRLVTAAVRLRCRRPRQTVLIVIILFCIGVAATQQGRHAWD